DHHRRAEPDHRPGPALAARVAGAEKTMGVRQRRAVWIGHEETSALFQISSDHLEQLLGGLALQHAWMRRFVDEMGTDMILDHLADQAGGCAAEAGDQVHDLLAAGLGLERTPDRLDLAADPAHPRQ